MKKGDLIIAIVWISLGIFIAIVSYKIKLGSFNQPGPGLIPFILGIALSLSSIPILIHSFLDIHSRTKQEDESIWKGVNLKNICLMVASLLFYPLILEKIGYIMTTFIVFLLLFKLAGFQKWRFALIASFFTAVISYLLFNTLLEVQLPFGPWR